MTHTAERLMSFSCPLRRLSENTTMAANNRNLAFDDVWRKLLEGIEHIYQFHEMTPAAWMQLYT
jgi:hypothetical protein